MGFDSAFKGLKVKKMPCNVPFIFSFPNSPQWARASFSRIHDHTRASYFVELLFTSDRPVTGLLPDYTQHNRQTRLCLRRASNPNPKKRAAPNPRLRPRGAATGICSCAIDKLAEPRNVCMPVFGRCPARTVSLINSFNIISSNTTSVSCSCAMV
jgi:hypothetical protein